MHDGNEHQTQLVWNDVLESIRPKLNASNFDKWLRPLTCTEISDGHVTLEAPNLFIRDWFEMNFLPTIEQTLSEVTGQPYQVHLKLPDPGQKTALSMIPTKASNATPKNSHNAGASTPMAKQDSSNATNKPSQPSSLNGKYTFENFVVGPSNQLAEAASRAVSKLPGTTYNPLFIYGAVGLGKTHLLSAIGNAIVEEHPTWNVIYVSSEEFVVDYINHLRLNRSNDFRRKYRKDCEVLLVDDIQFIAGKDSTQGEFFHIFNDLFKAGRQIVVSSDKFPHEIPALEERLKSRFQWGLIADIQSPEYETRVAILKKKADFEGIYVPEDVISYLASNIKTNVRELEGALIRLAALSRLYQGQDITLKFARNSLSKLIERTTDPLTIDVIIKQVATYYDVKISDIKGKRRQKTIALPRQIAMYLARTLTNHSYPEIGAAFGGRDHTTVISAVRKIETLLKSDSNLRVEIHMLEQKLER
ncbi:MAG: chromosomal replication initiator protein DnaA [Deltaproteobacteria bacterium]|nr:chromosomal replication initiator protein DnaA [Deltaproteobacteria bacterium]